MWLARSYAVDATWRMRLRWRVLDIRFRSKIFIESLLKHYSTAFLHTNAGVIRGSRETDVPNYKYMCTSEIQIKILM